MKPYLIWRYVSIFALTVSLFTAPPAGAQQSAGALDGFSPAAAAEERRLEEQFRAIPSPASARAHLRHLTARPHVAGTREEYELAVYVRDQLRAYGLAAELREYQVLLPYPKQPSIVEMIAPRRERLRVHETVVAEDPTSSDPKIIPLFNAYSASGDVTAPLVYVNYGLPNDYEALKKLGVEVRGRVAIARYGRSFRGVKAKVAEQNGAVGLLIYSDPADDGYMQGDVYPQGPWRPADSAQRGSIQYIFEYPGDPLTPGYAALPGAPRLKIDEAKNLPRIPVQPISYGDARRLLEPLRGPLRPQGFQGGLPFPYHVGGTEDVRVRLKTEMDYQTRSIWDVIARIDGAQEPERWVILGNHRDAWTFGAVDPNSGTTALLEVGRALGQLVKSGWRPRRTIMLCSWDGEEYGLIGSTEWAEEKAAELREKAVAYLNVDVAVAGPDFTASAVPSLWALVRAAARDVRDPKTGQSVYAAWRERAREAQGDAEPAEPIEPRIGALGSGSDYTPFLQHLGVPSLDMGFSGSYGVYHSAYDSFHWMEKFGDPSFAYHAAAAQVWGTVALRLANAGGLPFDYAAYAREIRSFVENARKTAARRGLAGAFDAAALASAADQLGAEAEQLSVRQREAILEIEASRVRADATHPRAVARLQRINDALMAAERALTDERGLANRAWYKHQIYAPGFYTGYAAQPLPDLTAAIDRRDAAAAREASQRIAEAIRRAAEILRRARTEETTNGER